MGKKPEPGEAARERDSDEMGRELDGLADAAALEQAAAFEESTPPPQTNGAFPVHLLPEPLRSYVAMGAKAIGCAASYIALPFLSAVASAIGNKRRIRLKHGWCEPSVIWTAAVGRSGTLKSPALDLALQPLRNRQAAAMRQHEEDKREYKHALHRYQADLARWKANGHQDGAAPLDEPVEPIAQRYLCADTTVEALTLQLHHRPRGLLMARDELSGWLRGFDQYRNGRGGDTAYWLEMHRAGQLVVDRKTGDRRTIYVPRAAVSVAGSIQPETLRRCLGRQHFENGLAARLLLAMPLEEPRQWTDAEVAPDLVAAVGETFDGLLALEFAEDDNGYAVPVDVPLSQAAKSAWVQFYNEHAPRQSELADSDLAAAWSKLEGYAARLGLVVHTVRFVRGEADGAEVDESSVSSGIAMAQWFAHETCRVYAALTETKEERQERVLLNYIRACGGTVTKRQLMRAGPCFSTADRAAEALDALAEQGWGHWVSGETTAEGGRPADVFQLDRDH